PCRLDCTLHREMTGFPILDDHAAAAIEGKVEGAVCSRVSPSPLWVANDTHLGTKQGLSVCILNSAAQHRDVPGVDNALKYVSLKRILARIEKGRGLNERGGDRAIKSRRYFALAQHPAVVE